MILSRTRSKLNEPRHFQQFDISTNVDSEEPLQPPVKLIRINFLEKYFQEYHQSQTVWIQIRPKILSGLIWVQTVCKSFQQMTLKNEITPRLGLTSNSVKKTIK